MELGNKVIVLNISFLPVKILTEEDVLSVPVYLTILISAPYAHMKIATRGNCVGFPSVNKRWLQPCFEGGIKTYR